MCVVTRCVVVHFSISGTFVSTYKLCITKNPLLHELPAFCSARSPLTKIEPYKWEKTKMIFIYMLICVFFFCLGFFVPLAMKYAMECPCVPVAKNTCYVREHVSICMIAIRR